MDTSAIELYTKNLNILYVEDSLTLRKLLQKKLVAVFKHVDTAKNGKEALALYLKNLDFYDIVLSDLEMPIMDGQTLSQSILELNYLQKIIIISSIEDFKKIIELINIGIHKFISKPVDDEQFYQVILDVAQQVNIQKLQDKEQEEVARNNKILQEREEALLVEKAKNLKELTEFKKAIDIGAIVSKTTPHGIITYVNDEFCRISGRSREELLGQNQNIVKSGNMDAHVYQRLWKTITSKKPYRGLLENRDKKGNIYHVENFITPILSTDDEIVEYISVSHDMTQLIQSLHDIKKAQKSKESFFTNISHEMKTPLNAILGFSSVLKSVVKDNNKALSIVKTIHESGNDLHELIDTVLDLGKLQDNRLTLKNSAFNPKELFLKCVEKYQEKASKNRQEFNVFIDENLPNFLLGDGERILQLLKTIFDNAVKFTPDEGHIEVEITYKNRNLHCKITDNGIGIKKEDQEKIFDYEQLDSNFTRSHEGAGVGLTLASLLIKLMHGEITVKSIPKKGSSFEVIIPLEEHNE